MEPTESKDQRHERRYPDKYNNEEDRKSEEKQKDANISRDIELQNGNSWLQRTRQGNSAVKNRCQITHELRFTEKLQGLYSARFSKSGEIIAAGFGSGAIQMRNGGTGELIATLKSGLEISMPVMCCRFNPVQKEIFYASSACGSIFMCNTYTKEFSRFIFELKNELILQYKRNEDLIESKATNFHRMRIFASRFHHEYPNLIITGGWDDTVRIWDIRVPTGSIRVIKGPHICGDAIDIRETRILTGSWVVRDSLQIWDLMSAKLIETINPQNRSSTLNGEFLYAVQYLDGDPYGDLILTGGSGTGALEVISLKEKKVMGSIGVNKPIFTIDSHQTTIIFGGIDSVLRLGDYN
ncbi:unnamed protein product [Lasius platythorax]|uniref:Uncharacterized protein n=1 Tax=Lasius platythorax TaxID=488582 RepID=A0AAV2N181_9HYME